MGATLRVKALAFVLGALVLPGTAMSDPPANLPRLYEPPLPKPGDRADRTFANGVSMYGNLIYLARPGYRPLTLDLYLPRNHRHLALPLVIWIHGGGYEIGNPRADWTYGDWSAVLARLARRGYAVAAISYRFKREAPFPAQLEDAQAAIGFLGDHAGKWNIDRSRTFVWGLSAGGHLASLLAMQSAGDASRLRVRGVADWFGPTDLATFDGPGAHSSVASLLGCAMICSADALAAASPVNYITAKAPPVLIMHGVQDHLVPIAQADEFAERLRKAGVSVNYRRLEGMGHGFDGGTRAQQEAILRDTFAFFDQHSGVKASRYLRSSAR